MHTKSFIHTWEWTHSQTRKTADLFNLQFYIDPVNLQLQSPIRQSAVIHMYLCSMAAGYEMRARQRYRQRPLPGHIPLNACMHSRRTEELLVYLRSAG